MSSTSFSSAAPLSQVIPFPARKGGIQISRDEPLRQFEAVWGFLERIMDFCAVVVAVWLAYRIQAATLGGNAFAMRGSTGLAASAGFGLLMVLLLERNGDYRGCVSLLAVRETERVLRATLSAFSGGVLALAFMTKSVPLVFCACAMLTVPLGLAVEKWHLQKFSKFTRRKLGVARRAVIVGTGTRGRRIFSALVRSPKLGIDPVAFVELNGDVQEPTIYEVGYQHENQARVLQGPVTKKMLRQLNAKILILADHSLPSEQISALRQAAENNGTNVYAAADPRNDHEAEVEYLELDGVMLAYAMKPLERRCYEAAKRALDITVSLLTAVPGVLVFVAAALAVKLTSPGPVIFRQQRVGRDGRLFELYKFRTMYVDSETYARSPVSGSDPRITPIGRILRHICIDELPQLVNVLKGEMSIVGPRPEMPFIVEKYEAIHLKRLRMKPGITGLWQLSADRLTPIHENISYDLYYARHRSLLMDVAILLHTVVFAFRGV